MNAKDLSSKCANGCGFYGNPATQNMCSVCYRNFLKKSALETEVKLPHTMNRLTLASHADDVTTNVKNTDVTPTTVKKTDVAPTTVKKTSNHCVTCKKRVGLTGFKCRCGGMYCGSHRLPEAHDCGFDHKKLGLEVLSKTLYSAAECKAAKLYKL